MPTLKFKFEHRGKNNTNNYLFEERFVHFANVSGLNEVERATEEQIEYLERDIEVLEAKLNATYDLQEKYHIKAEIEALKNEKGQLEQMQSQESSQTDSDLLLYGLSNTISALDKQAEGEMDLKKRQIISAKKGACLESLRKRRKAIENQHEFNQVLDDIDTDNFIVNILKNDKLDHRHLDMLLESDIKPFFDEKLIGELSAAREQMLTNDRVQSTLRPKGEAANLQADEEWFKFKSDVESEINNLNNEYNQKKDSKKPEEQKRATWIKGYLPHLEKQLKKRTEWTYKRKLQLEKELSPNLLENISPEIMDNAQKLMIEARSIRMEQIRLYLKKQYEKLANQFEKTKSTFSEDTIKGMWIIDEEGNKIWQKGIEEHLDDFQKKILDSQSQDPKALKQLAHNLEEASKQLNRSGTEVEKFKTEEGRQEALQSTKKRMGDVEFEMQKFTPERIARLKEELERHEIERLKKLGEDVQGLDFKTLKEKSRIFRQRAESLEELEKYNDPQQESKLRTYIDEFKDILQKPDEIVPEELQSINEEIETLHKKFSYLAADEKIDWALDSSKLDNAQKARKAINELKNTTDIKEIRRILEENFDSSNLEFVNNKKFEEDYRAYTPTGFMVFYERGDEWKIIIDEESLENPENGENLQKQITHELLHLEFDKNEDLQKAWIENYTKNPEKWALIKIAFADAFPDKKPPNFSGEKEIYEVDDWQDEDVINELFAMQNEIGHVLRPGDTSKFNKLRELIIDAGIPALALGAVDDKGEPTIRGYTGDEAKQEKQETDKILEKIKKGGGAYSEKGYSAAKKLQDRIEKNDREIKEMFNSEYIGYIPGLSDLLKSMEGFNNQTIELNETLAGNYDETLKDKIDKRIDKVATDLSQMRRKVTESVKDVPNKYMNPLMRTWHRTTFMSLDDIFQVAVDVKEYVQRRYSRKKADHAARLGMALFQNTILGQEASARKEKAEIEEVNEWKNRLENQDAWELKGLITQMSKGAIPNKDQLKAILRVLAEKGRIDWRQEELWQVLNKLQSAVHLTPNDAVLLHDPPLLRQKLHTALGEIWDYDEFTGLERKNESSYDSEKQQYLPSYDKMQDQLTDRLEQLLDLHRSGERVDPTEYESIIVYAIEKGKSFEEAVMFHLIVGMAVGLLTPDRGMALDKYLNQWPATQWIYNQNPPLNRQDYLRCCEENFKNDFNAGSIQGENGKEFKNFFWTEIQNDPMVIQRVRKSVSERGWDHDWTRTIAPLGDANTAKRFLSGRSGQQQVQDTGIENTYVGALQWLEENATNPDKIDFRKEYTRQIGFLTMSEGILDHVAYLGDNFTRANASMEKAMPRLKDIGNHGDWNLGQHRQKIRIFLDQFDPELFKLLRDKTKAKAGKKDHGTEIREYLKEKYPEGVEEWESIQTVDDVFEKIDFVIQTITSESHISDTEFRQKISKLREGL